MYSISSYASVNSVMIECKKSQHRLQTHHLEPNTTLQSWWLADLPQDLVSKADLIAEKWLCQVFLSKKKNLLFDVTLYCYSL